MRALKAVHLPVLGEVVYEYPQLGWLKRPLLKLPSPSLISCTSSHTSLTTAPLEALGESVQSQTCRPPHASLLPKPFSPLRSSALQIPVTTSPLNPQLLHRPQAPGRGLGARPSSELGASPVCFLALEIMPFLCLRF